ncbi:MAG: response regulator transcription factor [Butyrivibrio sp.]|nr:response regulator transcription factor [Butyrivibrio sp.]MBR4356385.1 response regulator transcription factor [Butyrivibrio sp.]MBR4640529.1 response regulator transcription factor [Butyrivibrio sp.]MEE3470162.1 response regulator transcription factor [Butyrivibrio hungatei]
MNKFQILIVEDDPPIRNLIATTLKTHDYKYLLAKNAEEAILQASTCAPDVVFLDLGLPDLDGIEVIKRIREWSNMPIIVISARSEDEDKIEALDAGADDYLTKPFSVEELLARLRVMQRRIAILQADTNVVESSVYVNGGLKIDFAAGCAYRNEEELKLTPIEYKLLCLLAQNTGKVLTHKYITQKIWGSAWDSNVASLRVFMATLRKKIEGGSDSVSYIQTHVGIGYRMLKADAKE